MRPFLILQLLYFTLTAKALANSSELLPLNQMLDKNPRAKIQGEIIKILPEYYLGAGTFEYDLGKKNFRFEYESLDKSQTTHIQFDLISGLKIEDKQNQEKLFHVFTSNSDNNFLQKLFQFLPQLKSKDLEKIAKITARFEEEKQEISLTFSEGYYFSQLKLYFSDKQTQPTHIRLQGSDDSEFLMNVRANSNETQKAASL